MVSVPLEPVRQETVYRILTWPHTERSKYQRGSHTHTEGPRRPACTPVVTKTKQAVCGHLGRLARRVGGRARGPPKTTQPVSRFPWGRANRNAALLPYLLANVLLIKSRLHPGACCASSDPGVGGLRFLGGLVHDPENQIPTVRFYYNCFLSRL